MVGLHGAGKTTTSAKLAKRLTKDGKTPMLVACDIYRPAAIDQLEYLQNRKIFHSIVTAIPKMFLKSQEQLGKSQRKMVLMW